jgi:hypothetical protein
MFMFCVRICVSANIGDIGPPIANCWFVCLFVFLYISMHIFYIKVTDS